MFLRKKYFKNVLMALGVVLWVGALSPEIFMQLGIGCILDENEIGRASCRERV